MINFCNYYGMINLSHLRGNQLNRKILSKNICKTEFTVTKERVFE